MKLIRFSYQIFAIIIKCNQETYRKYILHIALHVYEDFNTNKHTLYGIHNIFSNGKNLKLITV
jgi:hypothetical protein